MNAVKASLRDVRDKVGHIDVFICSASFEARCYSVASVLSEADIRQVLVCQNRNSSPEVARNGRKLRKMFGDRAEIVSLDKVDPLFGADNMQKSVARVGRLRAELSYLIDITTLTHEALLILLLVVRAAARKGDRFAFVYNIASQYSIGSGIGEEWLSKGVREIRSVLGYPGRLVPSRPLHLIVLAGLERERVEYLIDSYEPEVLSVGTGDKGSPHWEFNRAFYDALTLRYKGCSHFEFSTADPTKARASVETEIARLPDLNIVVAPMNNKVSTVGVALAAFSNPDIQVCYASAMHYNVRNYSVPSSDCYLFEMDLRSTGMQDPGGRGRNRMSLPRT
jgi:hypothetical protein